MSTPLHKFTVRLDNLEMECRPTQNLPYKHLILVGTINGIVRMSTDVRALRRLPREAFHARLESTASFRLAAIRMEQEPQ